MAIIDSTELVDRSVRAKVGDTSRRPIVSVSASPRAARRPHPDGTVQLSGERLRFGLGDQGVGVVVGAAHALGDGGGERVGEPVGDVAALVEPAALDDRVVEHVGDGAAQGRGSPPGWAG
jgi:hypothetical protein